MGQKGKRVTFPEEVEALIVKSYVNNNESLQTIATRYDCSPPTISRVLRNNSVVVKSRGRRKGVHGVVAE